MSLSSADELAILPSVCRPSAVRLPWSVPTAPVNPFAAPAASGRLPDFTAILLVG
jgi:hypothetical protein